jgi:hypothetical protein
MNTKHEIRTAWDASLFSTLALVQDMEHALTVFKVDITKALENSDPESRGEWERLAVFDLRDVSDLLAKIKRQVK